jgi:acid phosphatase type 7
MRVRLLRAWLLAGCVAGHTASAPSQESHRAAPAIADSSHVLLVAGDIAQCPLGAPALSGAAATAALIERLPGTVLALGDLAYRDGSSRQLRDCYGPTWGRFKERTWPVPGNHDYRTPKAQPYFDYWGLRAGTPGKGYYAIDVGGWRVIALNSNIDAGPGSEQMLWLAAELGRNNRRCTLAFWHHPRFSSGGHGDALHMSPAWKLLSEAGADVVLSAHDHGYERLAPLNIQGNVDPEHGVRSFVVGTGGAEQRAFEQARAGSEVRGNALGVLALTLMRDEYAWEFVPVAGESFADRGTGKCRN